MTYQLHQEILSKVEMSPIEDLLLALLPQHLPGVRVQTLIQAHQPLPFVTIRNTGSWGDWDGDPRGLDAGQVTIDTFVEGINADEENALLQEAIRVILRDSLNKVIYEPVPRGHLKSVNLVSRPRRVTDWATSTGPVQYADLPAGTTRWESIYQVVIRKPRTKPFAV